MQRGQNDGARALADCRKVSTRLLLCSHANPSWECRIEVRLQRSHTTSQEKARHASKRHLSPLFLLSAEKIAGKFKRYFPNVLSVLADGPIGGEPRHSCNVEHACARPIESRQPQPLDASLSCKIDIEIRCHHVVVGIAQRIHKRPETVSLVGLRLTEARIDGSETFVASGRPVAIVSKVMLQYRPAPPPRTPVRRK